MRAGAKFKIPRTPDSASIVAAAGIPGPQSIEGVKAVVAVASGKGGVGKSTVSANFPR